MAELSSLTKETSSFLWDFLCEGWELCHQACCYCHPLTPWPQTYVVGSRRSEQLHLHSQQRIVTTVEDSVLRTEMTDDYNNIPPNTTSFMPVIVSTSGRLRLLFLEVHRETDRFFSSSGVHLEYSTSGLFHCLLSVFSQLKSWVGNILNHVCPLWLSHRQRSNPILFTCRRYTFLWEHPEPLLQSNTSWTTTTPGLFCFCFQEQ